MEKLCVLAVHVGRSIALVASSTGRCSSPEAVRAGRWLAALAAHRSASRSSLHPQTHCEDVGEEETDKAQKRCEDGKDTEEIKGWASDISVVIYMRHLIY